MVERSTRTGSCKVAGPTEITLSERFPSRHNESVLHLSWTAAARGNVGVALGAFVKRELNSAARRPATYQGRVGSVLLPAAVIAGCAVAWHFLDWDRTSVEGAKAFGLSAFGLTVAAWAGTLLGLVPVAVAPGIAVERDRKTLDALLATRLTSAEIVLGVMTAKLAPCFAAGCAMLPVFVLVVYLGGIDVRWMLLAAAGTGSAALAIASLSVAASAGARTARRAVAGALLVEAAWFFVPAVVLGLCARGWPAWAVWARPALLWILDSSPFAVVTHVAGLARRASLPGAVLRMIALQSAISLMLILWASRRLRPASRAVHDSGGRAAIRRGLLTRGRGRPPCGDDPIVWNEMHSTPVGNVIGRRVAFLIQLLWVGMLVAATSSFALPAFAEVLERGYGASADVLAAPTLHPVVRLLVRTFTPYGSGPAPGQARLEFNIVLRQTSILFSFLWILVVAGTAAESITAERDRDTWEGLLLTPLTGAEILRAKMFGALWKSRECAAWMLGIWIAGLCAGALHPVGFCAGLVQLGASGWFCAAVGSSASLWSATRDRAVARGVVPPSLLALSGIIVSIVPQFWGSVLLGAGSAPFLTWASLVSYEDIDAALRSNVFPQLAAVGVRTGEGSARVLAAWLLGTTAQLVGAFLLTRRAFREFDAAVGRPCRKRPRTGT